jgi:long-subunit acyl-CoA synthetase (AMP-forming)
VECYLSHAGEALAAASGLDDPAGPDSTAEPAVPWEVAVSDSLLIMFTSGATITLKGAVLSHENYLFGVIHNLHR